MNRDDFRLIDQVTPQINGLVWISKGPLLERPFPFQEVDYLCNGQLTKLSLQLAQHQPESKSLHGPHFFFTKQFGKNFFVTQVQNLDVKETREKLKQTLQTQLSKTENDKIALLLINKTGEDFSSPLKKEFPNVEFKHFEKEER